MELTGKCAVVTGGAMGIGLATSKRLLEAGCRVTIWDLNENALKEAAAALIGQKGKVFFHSCDVTDKEKVYSLAKTAIEEMGRVDILINNAGFVKGGDFLSRNDEDWEKTIAVNLTGLIYTTKAFLPAMYERNEGHIINLSSASSVLGVPDLAIYTATKWAVWGLTESMRFEAKNSGRQGVKWSSIHPSYIATGMFEGAKIGFPGNMIVPLVKNHDVIARAIVKDALIKGKFAIRRPRTIRLAILLRGILPDKVFQWTIEFLGITKSMAHFKGRG
jgi:all-trans-retinol dehydrogenase (NAD+)